MPRADITPYAALGAYLADRAAAGERRVVLPFAAIETAILRRPLPQSARSPQQWRQWWERPGQPHAWEGWLRAGWHVEDVDLAGETVTFVRGAG